MGSGRTNPLQGLAGASRSARNQATEFVHPTASRGYDAIHLAALLQAGGPAHGAFACWEGDLRAPPAGSVQARSSLTALVSKAVSE